jgi:hypothetical protein
VTHSFGRVALLRAGADVVVDELRALTDPILDGVGA